MSDIIRLATGRVITRARAAALGLLDEDGNLKPTKDLDSQGRKLVERDEKRAAWARQQGLPAPEVKTTEDGLIRKQRIEPLRPQNVTKDGTPITDPDVLDAIAAQAAAIEAAQAEGRDLTKGEKRSLTMAINKAKAAAAAADEGQGDPNGPFGDEPEEGAEGDGA